MINEVKKKLQEELDKYLLDKAAFMPYYPGMNVFFSDLYKENLEAASAFVKSQNEAEVKNFNLYLDTIIVNMHTKVKKYKKSIYFDDENIKDIQNQGFSIPFFIDEGKGVYVLLGIVNSEITL
jgi:hypothetical protein